MKERIDSLELVEHLYDTSVNPTRLEELIALWDERIYGADPEQAVRLADFAEQAFARHIERALDILDQLQTAELRREDDLLSGIRGAAMVLSDAGSVTATNDAARIAFGLMPGGSLRDMPLGEEEAEEFAQRVAEIASAGGAGEDIAQLRPLGLDRVVMVHLKALRGTPGRRRVLAITSEQIWPVEVSGFLERIFALTPAEIDVTRLLTAGGSVGAIARATGRGTGTVRSQLHAIFAKTGTASQAEVVRLCALLLQSVRTEADLTLPRVPGQPRHRFLRMRDGRRIEIFGFGDPTGRPVVWTQSTLGFFRLPRAAQADLERRGLRMVVPIRAGYGGSDRPPPGRNNFDVAVEDMREMMRQLGIVAAPVVAPTDDIRLALMLAKADPGCVLHVFGLGSCFPILSNDQYRRLHAIGRFFRACARHAPVMLPFIAKAYRATVLRQGFERFIRSAFSAIPPDARAIENSEIREALISGFSYMFGIDARSEAAFCAELALLYCDWPEGLGDVACSVTLIHGEQDGNAPYETLRDYCAMHPAWRYIGFPDEGQLVTHVRWREVFDLIEQAAESKEAPLLADA